MNRCFRCKSVPRWVEGQILSQSAPLDLSTTRGHALVTLLGQKCSSPKLALRTFKRWHLTMCGQNWGTNYSSFPLKMEGKWPTITGSASNSFSKTKVTAAEGIIRVFKVEVSREDCVSFIFSIIFLLATLWRHRSLQKMSHIVARPMGLHGKLLISKKKRICGGNLTARTSAEGIRESESERENLKVKTVFRDSLNI